MKKSIFMFFIIVLLFFGITGCGDKKLEEHFFQGKIMDVSSSHLIVEPNEGEKERKSSDQIRIELENDETNYKVGMTLKITYHGFINESYLAQIKTTRIEIIETNFNYSKTIDNTSIELSIPTSWQYEEILTNNNDAYKYALKIFKNQEDKYMMLYYYNNLFSVCGTGRTTRTIKLDNGSEAIVGYYYDFSEWIDISFGELTSKIAFINYGLTGDDTKEAIDFMKTIEIINL